MNKQRHDEQRHDEQRIVSCPVCSKQHQVSALVESIQLACSQCATMFHTEPQSGTNILPPAQSRVVYPSQAGNVNFVPFQARSARHGRRMFWSVVGAILLPLVLAGITALGALAYIARSPVNVGTLDQNAVEENHNDAANNDAANIASDNSTAIVSHSDSNAFDNESATTSINGPARSENNQPDETDPASRSRNEVEPFHTIRNLGGRVRSLEFSPSGVLYAGKSEAALHAFAPREFTSLDTRKHLSQLGSISAIAATPDNRFLLTGGDEGRIEVWSLDAAGQLSGYSKFIGHSQAVRAIAISPDSRTAASGAESRVRVWDLETSRESFVFDELDDDVLALHFSTDGKSLQGFDGEVYFEASLDDGSILKRKEFRQRGLAAAFSRDGSLLAIANGYDLSVFDTQSQKIVQSYSAGETIRAVEFAADGKSVFTGCQDFVYRWSVASGQRMDDYLIADGGNNRTIAVSVNGNLLAASGSSDTGSISIFEIRNGTIDTPVPASNAFDAYKLELEIAERRAAALADLPDDLRGVNGLVAEINRGEMIKSLAFNDDGILIAATTDNYIRSIDWPTGLTADESHQVQTGGDPVVAVAGSHLLFGGSSGLIEVFEISPGGKLKKTIAFERHSEAIAAITVDAELNLVASSDKSEFYRIWELATGRQLTQFRGLSRQTRAAHFKSDGRVLITDGKFLASGVIESGKIETTKMITSNAGLEIAFSPDGNWLAISSGGGIEVIDTRSSESRGKLTSNGVHWSVVFSTDSRHLFAGGQQSIEQWNLESEKIVATYEFQPGSSINCLAVSPDGNFLAGCGMFVDQPIRVFRIATE